MNSAYYTDEGYTTWIPCKDALRSIYFNRIERHLEAPVPWVGMYIATASAVCTLAMAADAFNGIRAKCCGSHANISPPMHFPLTLLTVAMKLPVDLTNLMGVVVKKYWVMAETGSSQFVMACTVVCSTSGLMCVMMALTLVETHIRTHLVYNVGYGGMSSSSYKWSMNYIMIIQYAGVALGSIAPVFRWFVAVQFKSSKLGCRRFKDEFKIEAYWTQQLVEWRESSLPSQIPHIRCRKVLHGAKRLLLNVAIRIQILIVLASKLVQPISATFAATTFLFFHQIKKLKTYVFRPSNDNRTAASRAVLGQYLSQHILLLEGEPELPQKTMAAICNEVD